MAHQSFSKTVLDMVKSESSARNEEVDVTALSNALDLRTYKEHKRMLNTLSDLVKSGRVVRVRQGVYSIGTSKPELDKRDVMWRTLRMRKVVTIADLQEFADVSYDYAQEWLTMLVNRKVVMRMEPSDVTKPSSYRLIKSDLVEMPIDTKKAARLRELRRKKKAEIISAIDNIGDALRKVRDDVVAMEEEK